MAVEAEAQSERRLNGRYKAELKLNPCPLVPGPTHFAPAISPSLPEERVGQEQSLV